MTSAEAARRQACWICVWRAHRMSLGGRWSRGTYFRRPVRIFLFMVGTRMNKTQRIAAWIVIVAGILLLTNGANGQYRDVVLADQPVAYWRLGEADADLPANNLGLLGDEADGTYAPDAMVGQPSLIGGDADTSLRVRARPDA